MKKHRGLFLALGLTALMGLWSGQARAETISISISVNGGPLVDLSAFGGVGTAQGYNMSGAAIASLNSFLTTAGSEYQFGSPSSGATLLGGTSNNAGTSAGGTLVLTGSIESVGSGSSLLTIVESEGGYTAPTGLTGTLFSSSTGNFSGQAAGAGHTASSAFTSDVPVTTPTSTYNVFSTTTDPNGQGSMTNVGVAPVTTLYTLTNTITFGLGAGTTANPITDTFGVNALVTAAAVPEPSSLVTLLTGIPLPILFMGLLRRRRAAA